MYSRKLCRVLRLRIREIDWDHPLLLVGCYLNSLFPEMESIDNDMRRTECRSAAEEFARKLVRRQKDRLQRLSLRDSVIDLAETVPDSVENTVNVRDVPRNTENSSSSANVGGKKRPFSLRECADTVEP